MALPVLVRRNKSTGDIVAIFPSVPAHNGLSHQYSEDGCLVVYDCVEDGLNDEMVFRYDYIMAVTRAMPYDDALPAVEYLIRSGRPCYLVSRASARMHDDRILQRVIETATGEPPYAVPVTRPREAAPVQPSADRTASTPISLESDCTEEIDSRRRMRIIYSDPGLITSLSVTPTTGRVFFAGRSQEGQKQRNFLGQAMTRRDPTTDPTPEVTDIAETPLMVCGGDAIYSHRAVSHLNSLHIIASDHLDTVLWKAETPGISYFQKLPDTVFGGDSFLWSGQGDLHLLYGPQRKSYPITCSLDHWSFEARYSSRGGARLILCGPEGKMELRQLHNNASGHYTTTVWQCKMDYYGVDSARFIDDRGSVVAGSWSGRLECRDELSHLRLSLRGHQSAIRALAVSESALAASGDEDGLILVWNLEDGRLQDVMEGHTGQITGLAFDSCDGVLYLISGSKDGTIRRWRVSSELRPSQASAPTGQVLFHQEPPPKRWLDL